MTPLIDIIFQLVLFFMVSTTFLSAPGIQIDLPKSSAEVIVQEQKDLHIWMTHEGEIFLDEKPVTLAGLESKLIEAAREDPGTQVNVKADTLVGHGQVVLVMDMARNQGLTRLSIATDPGAPGPVPEEEREK